jgi:hypothetical protein
MSTSVTPYLVPISAAVLLLVVVAVIVLRYLLTPRITAPLCRRCRYDVTGLPTSICPECGADLSEVGILQPGSVKPMGRLMRLSLWTISVGAVALIVTPPILRSIPPLNQTMVQHTLSIPGSRLYKSVVVDAVRSWRRDSQSAKAEVLVTLTRLDDQQFEMAVFPIGDDCKYVDSTGRKHRKDLPVADPEVAAKTVVAWLDGCGIAASGDALLPEATQIAKAIDECVSPPQQTRMSFGSFTSTSTWGTQFRGSSSGGFRTSFGAPFSSTATRMNSGRAADPWPLRIAIGGWCVIWLLGAGVILFIAARQHPAEPGVL